MIPRGLPSTTQSAIAAPAREPMTANGSAWRVATAALAASIVGPLVAYVITASGYAHWLDTGEFVAVASDLGISHPPGHPLAGLTLGLARLLPFGPLAFRVSILCGICLAAASGFFHRALEHTLKSLGVGLAARACLSTAGTWWLAFSFAAWFQAVRPEVYALQAWLIAIAIERILAYETRWPDTDRRPLYVAALAFSLALANHHFLAFLLLPAAAPTLARVVRDRGTRPLAVMTGFGLAGLLTYAYLPIRAAREPLVNLGEPTTLSRLYWVVSAEAFQKSAGTELVRAPLGQRFADVLIHLGEDLHVWVLLMALLGAYVLLRFARSRRVAVFWLLVMVVYVAARTWLGFVRSNPDAFGYLLPAMMAVVALAVAGVGIVIGMIEGSSRPAAVVLSGLLAVGSGYQLMRRGADANLSQFTLTDTMADPGRRDLPNGAVLLVYNPETLFALYGGEGEERLRPDITIVPMMFLNYPGMVERLVRSEPALRRLFRGERLHGELQQPDVESLAAQRPLFVELDVRVPYALYESLAPELLYARVLAGGSTRSDVEDGRRRLQPMWARIEADMGQGADAQSTGYVLMHRFMEALLEASMGDREGARASVAAALRRNPEEQSLRMLEALLGDPEARGRVDVTPILRAVRP